MAVSKNKIYIGSVDNPDFYFDEESIMSANIVQNVALVGTELSVDSFTPVVIDTNDNLRNIRHFRSSDGQEIRDAVGETYCIDIGDATDVSPLIMLDNGTPVWYYQEDALIGKFYVKSVERVGRNQYQLNTVSAIGMLDEMDHVGGMFTSTDFGTVLAHILAKDPHGTGDPVIEYAIDQDVAELPVSGWLPHDTKRNNLYQLIFANGVNIVKNVDSREEYNGVPRFTFLYSSPYYAVPIDSELVYDQGSVSYEKPYTNVVVLEHTYTPVTTEDPVTLFDNTTGAAADNTEVWFDNAPIIVSTLSVSGTLEIAQDPITGEDLVTENSVILETGNGTLTGIPYLHDTRAVNTGDSSSSEEKTIRVENATFVNVINSENLRLRLYAFYCPENYIHKISNGIVHQKLLVDEVIHDPPRCGKMYEISDPYGKLEDAFLSRMDITMSAVNKAECEWYAGYVPAGQEGLYKHEPLLLNAETYAEDGGVFTWPDGVTPEKCQIIIIGGGTGGGSGWPGENGEDAMSYTEVESTADLSAVWYGAEGGEGGAGGAGGSPGRVKIVTIDNPSASYNYTIGEGGEGGAATGFRPDTISELRAAMENEYPETTYTDAELETLIETEDTDWDGTPNTGSAGTASTFGEYSSADEDGYVPVGGFYDSIGDHYYALYGNKGISGGKGGARQVKSGSTFNWITDGEDVVGDEGETYRGGSTGKSTTSINGLPEAKLNIYGGNGAGAAVGIGRGISDLETGTLLYPHINGGSEAGGSYNVVTDSEWYPPSDAPTPTPSPSYQPISATLTVDKTTADVGETITWTASATGGDGDYTYFFTVMYSDDVVAQHGEWQSSNVVTFTPTQRAKYYVAGFVNDSRGTGMARIENGCMVDVQTNDVEVSDSTPFPPDPAPETPGEYGYLTAVTTVDRTSGTVGDTITWTVTPSGGHGNLRCYMQVRADLAEGGEYVYMDADYVDNFSFSIATLVPGNYYCEATVYDQRTEHSCYSVINAQSAVVHIEANQNDTTWANAPSERIVQLIQAAHRGEINLQNDLGWQVGDERIVYVQSYNLVADSRLPDGYFKTQGEFHKIAISSFGNYNGCGNVLQFDFTTRSGSFMFYPSPYASSAISYGYTQIYRWYCPNCVEALPNWLKGLLMTFSVVAAKGPSWGSETEMVGGNKLALRSASEVYGANHNSIAYEGDQIALYQNSDYYLKDMARLNPNFPDEKVYAWWGLRSIHSNAEYCRPTYPGGIPGTVKINNSSDFCPFGCI